MEDLPETSQTPAVAPVGNGTVLNAVVLLPVHIPELGIRRVASTTDVQTCIDVPAVPRVAALLQRLVLVAKVRHPLRIVTFADARL